VAVEGKPLTVLLADLYRRVGEFHTHRDNIRLSPELEESFAGRLAKPPATFAGKKVAEVITIDGSKFVLDDGSWVLFRKSGTEPVVRVYGESSSEAALRVLMKAADQFIRN
jgi:phosphomannomutase